MTTVNYMSALLRWKYEAKYIFIPLSHRLKLKHLPSGVFVCTFSGCTSEFVWVGFKRGCSLFFFFFAFDVFFLHSFSRKISQPLHSAWSNCLCSSQTMYHPTSRRSRCAVSSIWNATGWCWRAWRREAGRWSSNGSTTTPSWPASHWSTGERIGLMGDDSDYVLKANVDWHIHPEQEKFWQNLLELELNVGRAVHS